MTLWSGRFSTGLAENAWALNSSLSFDQRLATQDVRGSIAWAEALLQAGVISEAEHIEILNGLNTIAAEFENQTFSFFQTDEDIHTAVERRLGELMRRDFRKTAHRAQPQRPGGNRFPLVDAGRAAGPGS